MFHKRCQVCGLIIDNNVCTLLNTLSVTFHPYRTVKVLYCWGIENIFCSSLHVVKNLEVLIKTFCRTPAISLCYYVRYSQVRRLRLILSTSAKQLCGQSPERGPTLV
uniref:Molybdate-anion transporter n=1 Tax=Parascaris univalens TaxID=6257 RepID=A0A915BHV1_PARUN